MKRCDARHSCHHFFTATYAAHDRARQTGPPSLCLRSANRPHVAARSARASLDRRTARGRHTCGGVRAGVRAMKHEGLSVLLLRVLAEMGCVFGGTFGGGNSRAFP